MMLALAARGARLPLRLHAARGLASQGAAKGGEKVAQ